MGSEFGDGGVTTILDSAEVLGITLLFPGVGFFVPGMVESAVGGGVVALLEGIFASGFPQWGQKAACRSSSPLQWGQRGVDGDEGCEILIGAVSDASCDSRLVPTSDCFCKAS